MDSEDCALNHLLCERENAIDQSTISRWFKKFYLGCKNLNNKARLSITKTMDSEDCALNHLLCEKENAVDHSTISSCFTKFHLG